MAELNAELFKTYFEGIWKCKVCRNGELTREVVVDWQADGGNRARTVSHALWTLPAGGSDDLEGPDVVATAGWHSDVHKWCNRWYNSLGGYAELNWTSQSVVNGVNVLYGSLHECEKKGDDPADYIAMCEIIDPDHFKYTIQCYRKGILEIFATRLENTVECDGNTRTDADTLEPLPVPGSADRVKTILSARSSAGTE